MCRWMCGYVYIFLVKKICKYYEKKLYIEDTVVAGYLLSTYSGRIVIVYLLASNKNMSLNGSLKINPNIHQHPRYYDMIRNNLYINRFEKYYCVCTLYYINCLILRISYIKQNSCTMLDFFHNPTGTGSSLLPLFF